MYFAFKHTVSKWRQEDVGDSQKWDLLDRDTLKEMNGTLSGARPHQGSIIIRCSGNEPALPTV